MVVLGLIGPGFCRCSMVVGTRASGGRILSFLLGPPHGGPTHGHDIWSLDRAPSMP